MSKGKQLSFPLSSTHVTQPLELIYTDVCGPSHVYSSAGNRYYVSFLDAFSRYTWLFPMNNKSDVCAIFIQFQKNVKRYFNSKIKIIQSDWGGEYRSLSKILTNQGISHVLIRINKMEL
jgi:transposase InsO family protein